MLNRIVEFVHALREAGIPIALSESIDATRAIAQVPLDERDGFREALAATMIKSDSHRPAFDVLFDLYFGVQRPGDQEALGASDVESPDEFTQRLAGALASGDAEMLGELAREAVARFGRVENSPSGSLYFQYPVFRAIDLEALLARYEEPAGVDGYSVRVARDAFEARVRQFRGLVEQDVNRRVAQRRGPETVARYAVRPPLEELDLATAGADEITALRKALPPLARKLATRIAARRKRSNRGRLDLRRTVRHSLSTGGVPFDPVMRKRVPHRPELFVLCDVSSSVARFARFSLMLVHALSAQFSRVRSFAFVDTIDEVTHLFQHEDFLVAVDRMMREAEVVWLDNHSNYATSFERFMERYGDDVTARTTVLILGDARNNNRVPRAETLKELHHRAHRVYWLNPEALAYWDSGDSAASDYALYTDGMIEVRNLRQLEDFIATVL